MLTRGENESMLGAGLRGAMAGGSMGGMAGLMTKMPGLRGRVKDLRHQYDDHLRGKLTTDEQNQVHQQIADGVHPNQIRADFNRQLQAQKEQAEASKAQAEATKAKAEEPKTAEVLSVETVTDDSPIPKLEL
jgi:predicted urease superfamily metal-dependent hydrolase